MPNTSKTTSAENEHLTSHPGGLIFLMVPLQYLFIYSILKERMGDLSPSPVRSTDRMALGSLDAGPAGRLKELEQCFRGEEHLRT